MRAVIISIGDEILNGTTINTNASWIATQIQPLGISIFEVIAISDNHEHILQTLKKYEGAAEFIFITGGLGPTVDDITKKTLCEFYASEYIFHESIYKRLKDAFEKRNIPFTENNRDQAMYPADCTIIPNPLGTAQGMWFRRNNSVLISMPGVPFEMKGMMTDTILPKIKNEFTLPEIHNLYLMTSGLSESLIAEKLSPVEKLLPPEISLAYLPSPGVVKLRFTMHDISFRNTAEELINKATGILGNSVYAKEPIPPEEYIGRLLKSNSMTLCSAESCTGGLIAHKITSVAGSSAYYKGSIIAYADEIKIQELHVRSTTIEKYGAVSEETVSEMLDGALSVFKSDYAIAVSGIAGPGGGTAMKPVGTIWIGVAGKNEKNIQKYFFNKNREINIEYACMFALHQLRLLLTFHLVKA